MCVCVLNISLLFQYELLLFRLVLCELLLYSFSRSLLHYTIVQYFDKLSYCLLGNICSAPRQSIDSLCRDLCSCIMFNDSLGSSWACHPLIHYCFGSYIRLVVFSEAYTFCTPVMSSWHSRQMYPFIVWNMLFRVITWNFFYYMVF